MFDIEKTCAQYLLKINIKVSFGQQEFMDHPVAIKARTRHIVSRDDNTRVGVEGTTTWHTFHC